MKAAGSLAATCFALAAVVALLPAVHAQSRPELERCSAITDPAARLACYDAAVAAAARAPAPPAPALTIEGPRRTLPR